MAEGRGSSTTQDKQEEMIQVIAIVIQHRIIIVYITNYKIYIIYIYMM